MNILLSLNADEPGMFIGLIKEGDALREFNGYLDKEESQKKVIQDVFVKGDKAFLTGELHIKLIKHFYWERRKLYIFAILFVGDILVEDEYGYIYFKDRVGDTFRWKGENVATAEVEGVISNIAGKRDATVYGVQVCWRDVTLT